MHYFIIAINSEDGWSNKPPRCRKMAGRAGRKVSTKSYIGNWRQNKSWLNVVYVCDITFEMLPIKETLLSYRCIRRSICRTTWVIYSRFRWFHWTIIASCIYFGISSTDPLGAQTSRSVVLVFATPIFIQIEYVLLENLNYNLDERDNKNIVLPNFVCIIRSHAYVQTVFFSRIQCANIVITNTTFTRHVSPPHKFTRLKPMKETNRRRRLK